MTNTHWALVGGLAGGVGGAATVMAFCAAVGETDPHNLRTAIGYGGTAAALACGLWSVGRGGPVGRTGRLARVTGLTVLAALLFVTSCPFGAVWLVALGGGLTTLAAVSAAVRTGGASQILGEQGGRDSEPG